MTGKSRIWATRHSALSAMGSIADLGRIIGDQPTTVSAKIGSGGSGGSMFFRSGTNQYPRTSALSVAVAEVDGKGDAGWDELPVVRSEEEGTASILLGTVLEVPDEDTRDTQPVRQVSWSHTQPGQSAPVVLSPKEPAKDHFADALQEFLERYVAQTVRELLQLQQTIKREGSQTRGSPLKASTLHTLVRRGSNSSLSSLMSPQSQEASCSEMYSLPEGIGIGKPTLPSIRLIAGPQQHSRCKAGGTSSKRDPLTPPSETEDSIARVDAL